MAVLFLRKSTIFFLSHLEDGWLDLEVVSLDQWLDSKLETERSEFFQVLLTEKHSDVIEKKKNKS